MNSRSPRAEKARSDRVAVPLPRTARAALVLAVFSAPAAQAGSVFMKNGYIIQGPLVERSEAAVVIGWDNGNMTIHRRFIDAIQYETGEEERLEQWRRMRDEEKRRAQEALEAGLPSHVTRELPKDFDLFLEQLQRPELIGLVRTVADPADPASGQDGPVPGRTDGTDPLLGDAGVPEAGVDGGSAGGSGLEPGVGVVDPQLAEPISASADGAVRLRPPAGWKVNEGAGYFQVVSPDPDAVRASLNILELERRGLEWEQCIELVREQEEEVLSPLVRLGEGRQTVGSGYEGYELVARGTLGGSALVVRQVLVPRGERLWLFSSFAPEGDDAAALALQRSLETVEFPAD